MRRGVRAQGRPSRVHVLLLLCVACMSAARGADHGDVHPYLRDTYSLDVGIFFPDRRFKIGADGSIAGDRAAVDFDEEFRLKTTDETFELDFGWRFAERWILGGQYFRSSNSGSAVLEEDVEWKDLAFLAGSYVAAGTRFDLTRVFLGRTIGDRTTYELGLGAGLHWLEIDAYIEGTALRSDGSSRFHRESVDVAAPLPNIGGWARFSLSRRWAVATRLDWLSADVGRYDGQLINLSLGVNCQLVEHFGIGLNYNFFSLDVGVDKSDWRGSTDASYEGPYLYLSAYW